MTSCLGAPRALLIAMLSISAFVLAYAAESPSLIVTIAADTVDDTDNETSLREAVAHAGTLPGADTVTFDAVLNGATIALTSGTSLTGDGDGITIDATALPDGLTIQSNATSRAVLNTGILTLRGITLTGAALTGGQGGGAVYSNGTLELDRCSLTGNSADFGGGALFSDGITTIKRSTIHGNSTAGTGSAIYNNGGTMTLENTTISNNSSTGDYSIHNNAALTLLHCTVAGNTANASAAIHNTVSGNLTVENSILGAGNTGTTDLNNAGTLTRIGANLAEKSAIDSGSSSGPAITIADPMLGSLANNDGPTPTLPLLAGSPAIDAAVGSTLTLDQRGASRPLDGDNSGSAAADLGAFELGVANHLTGLVLSKGSLSPAFDSATTNYTATVAFNVSNLTVTPTAAAAGATIAVNGNTTPSGSASATINLGYGANAIPIVVTGDGGLTTRTYTVTVTREVSLTETYIGSLDGVSQQSTFETGAVTALPTLGWTAVSGSAQVFDAGNGAIIGTSPFGAYQVQYVTGTAVQPNTLYRLRVNMGYLSGGAGNGTGYYEMQIGTMSGGVFTPLGSETGFVFYEGNMNAGVTTGALLNVRTGSGVSGDPLAVRWAVTGNGGREFFGVDDVTLAIVTNEPDIHVSGNGIGIANGDLFPYLADHTDFGEVDLVSGDTLVRTFTIENQGSATVNLTGTPRVEITGAFASDYAITTQPAASIAPGESTTFTVTFSPQGAGLRRATLRIANNDGDENPYEFAIQGTVHVIDELDLGIGGNGVRCIAMQPDGKMIIAGFFTSVLGAPIQYIARINADGTLDSSFNPNPDSGIFSVAVQPDGKILIGGGFTSLQPNGAADPIPRSNIARLNADGTIDSSFQLTTDGTVWSADLQPDGKILLCGTFLSLDSGDTSIARQGIARVHADGTPDAGFDLKANNYVMTTARQPDGKILIAGGFTSLQPNGSTTPVTRNRIARINADGSLDTGFDPNANNIVYAVALKPDGSLFIGGTFTQLQPNGAPSPINRARLARLNPDGSLDTSFQLQPNQSVVYSLDLQADGKLLISGDFEQIDLGDGNTVARGRVARLNPDGSLDMPFNPNPNSVVDVVTAQADGKILIGGSFTSLQPGGTTLTTTRLRFARIDNDPANQILSVPDDSHILWTRGGSAPEFSRVFFEVSTDGGATYSSPIAGTRVGTTANWQVTGLSLQGAGMVRARGITLGGSRGSPGIIGQSTAFDFSPEISISGNGTSIAAGDDSPSPDDHTDFGDTAISNDPTLRTFTIENTGHNPLQLTGTPLVEISGTHAGEFTVITQPASSLAMGESTTFTIRLDPADTGLRTAAVSIANNDPDEDPYEFSLQGNGTLAGSAETIISPLDEVSQESTFETGTTTPLPALGWTMVSGTARIFDAGNGAIIGTAPYDNYEVQYLTGTEITADTRYRVRARMGFMTGTPGGWATYLLQLGTVNGGVFTPLGSESGTVTYTGNLNSGISTRAVLDVVTGSTVSGDPLAIRWAQTGSAGTSDFFGVDDISLTIDNSPTPEVQLTGNGNPIADKDSTPSLGDHTDFGNASSATPTTHTFTISNTGSLPLALTGTPRVAVTGANAADFIVTAQPADSVAVGGSTTFSISFSPGGIGLRTATVSIASNDTDENPFTFSIQGTGAFFDGDETAIAPLDGVSQASTFEIGDLRSLPFLGWTNVSGAARVDDATNGIIRGINFTDNFEVQYVTSTAVAPNTRYRLRVSMGFFSHTLGGSASYHLQLGTVNGGVFTPLGSEAGTVSALGNINFSIYSGRAVLDVVTGGVVSGDPLAVRWAQTGTSGVTPSFGFDNVILTIDGAARPEIQLSGNGNGIANGDATPSMSDHTDFGGAGIGHGSIIRTFTIGNAGTVPLHLTNAPAVSLSGPNAAEFSVTTPPVSPVAPGANTTFSITFSPQGFGPRRATVSIASDDPDQTPHAFEVQGYGTYIGEDETPIAPLDSVSQESNFESGAVTLLPALGWTNVAGSARVFDVGNGAIIETAPYAPYEVQHVTDTAVAPHTHYRLRVDMGFMTGTGGGSAGYQLQLGTVNGGVFTPLGSTTGTVNYTGSLNLGIASPAVLDVTTGAVVSGDPLAVRWAQTSTNAASDFFGFDNVTLTIVSAPEINVTGNGADIADGDISPSLDKHTDFGDTYINATTTTRTFTIGNAGTDSLNLTGTPRVVVSGTHAADFTVATQPAASVPAGDSTTFSITFDPGAAGLRQAMVTIANDDDDENPYAFAIQGMGVQPSALESFRIEHFSTAANSGNAADDFDFDKDGLPNLLEYAFGLNPTLASSRQLPTIQHSGGNLSFTFNQPDGVSGITYIGEWSATLKAEEWNNIPNTATPPQYQFSVPKEGKPQLFLRLRVTNP